MENIELKESLKLQADQKKEALQQFIQWNKENRDSLKNAKTILDKLFHRLDSNINNSKQRYDYINSFFKNMHFQIQTSVELQKGFQFFEVHNIKVENGQEKIVKNLKFRSCIGAFERDFGKFQNSLKMIEKRIENQVIKKIMIEKLKENENILQNLIIEIQKVNRKLQEASLEASKFQKGFIRSFQESVKKNEKGKINEKNYFVDVMIIISQLCKISKLLQKVIENFFKLHEHSIKLEQTRNNSIQDALVVYINIINESFGEEKGMIFRESKELLLNNNLDDFAEDSFSIRKLLNNQEVNFVLSKSGMDELNLESLKKCLLNCIEQKQNKILPFFYLFSFQGTVRSGCFQVQDVSIFLNHDYYYSIYSLENNVIRELLINVPLQEIDLNIDYRQNLIKINFKQKGWLWDSEKFFELSLNGLSLVEVENLHLKYQRIVCGQEIVDMRRGSNQTRITDLSISDNSQQENEQDSEELPIPVENQEINQHEENLNQDFQHENILDHQDESIQQVNEINQPQQIQQENQTQNILQTNERENLNEKVNQIQEIS